MLRELAFEGLPGSTDFRGTPESLKTVRIADLKAHAANWYRPENMMLGVAGDFRADHALRKLDRAIRANFGTSGKSPLPATISPAVFERPLPPGRIRVMRSPGSQTHIVMGHRTVARTHPDWVALQVLEIVVGSGPGLTDLLSRRLREDLGLIYGVNMAMTEGAWTTPGHMRISFSCDPADAGKAEAETMRILAEVSQGRLSDEDCLQARDHFTNSWFLGFESADDRLSSRLDTELEGWDLDLPPHWSRRSAELTAEDIRQAARKHIRPEFLQVVRYGP
jgi:zinc protease